MGLISIYAPGATDFSTNGLGLLMPVECTIEEQANGMYELTLVHPITDDLRWAQLQTGCIIKAEAPMRESPLYEAEAFEGIETTTTTVTRKLYRVRVNTRLRLRAKPNTSSKILGRYANGTEVVRLKDMGNGWFQVMIRKGGATGYMSANYLNYVRDFTETVTATKPVTREGVSIQPTREQLFRVYSTETNTEARTVTAKAMHVFYDLRGNPVNKAYSPKNADANTAVSEIFSAALMEHEFEAHSYLSDTITGEYGYKSIPECLLDPDEGIVTQTGGLLVRDNFDVFILPDIVRDMGVTIRRGKNLIGVTVETDMTDVITRIIPVGIDKNGKDLFLGGTIYRDSKHIDAYPTILAKRIDYDVKVGTGDGQFANNDKARSELERLAYADFDNGVDLPTYGMEVNFVLLGNTAEYENYASLQSVHLFDTVTVIDELVGLKAKVRVTGYKWNVLSGKYESVTLGKLQDLQQTTYGYTIANGTVSGTKLIPNSVDGTIALRNLSIQYAKIAQAAIEQLQADAIVAVRAHINEIVAGEITTDQLYADFAKIASLEVAKATFDYANIKELDVGVINALIGKFEQISAGELVADELYASFAEIINLAAKNLEADSLSAALGNFVTMYAGTGEFDFATIQNLVAKAMALQQGSMDTVYIRNLAVTTANMLSATLGKLVIKGDHGKYYRVFISATGEVKTEEVQPTEDEIQSGQTSGGQQIVETSMNVGNLNATTIQGSSAVINEILTVALNADKITAADALIASATIPALYATSIKAIGDNLDLSANESIKSMVGDLGQIYRSETPPPNAPLNAIWVQPSTGYVFQNTSGADVLPEFFADADGNLYYRYEEGQEAVAFTLSETGDLYMSADAEFGVKLNDDGTPTVWKRVKDGDIDAAQDDLEEKINGTYSELTQTIDGLEFAVKNKVDADELQTYMRYKDGTLELGRKNSRYNTQTSDTGFVVLQDGVPMTSMEQNRVSAPVINARRMFSIGDYSIFTGATGHLIFN